MPEYEENPDADLMIRCPLCGGPITFDRDELEDMQASGNFHWDCHCGEKGVLEPDRVALAIRLAKWQEKERLNTELRDR